MRYYSIFILYLLIAHTSLAQGGGAEEVNVLGTMTLSEFEASADSAWLRQGMITYDPNADVIAELRTALEGVDEVVVYYGSWCGDSRSEVPKVVDVLESAGYPTQQLTFVGVAPFEDSITGYKQSPDGATVGHHVYRVPTIRLVRGGRELGRVLEKPLLSVERDLLAIASGADYSPAYPILGALSRLDDEGLLDDPNVKGYSLAHALFPYAQGGPGALNGAGYVLLAQGRPEAALKVFYANMIHHRDEADVYDSLAEGFAAVENTEGALNFQREAVKRDPAKSIYLENLEKYARAGERP